MTSKDNVQDLSRNCWLAISLLRNMLTLINRLYC